MRNIIKHDLDDSLRPEYKRSDFGEIVQGKYASAEVELGELARLLLSCIGQDEGVTITRRSTENRVASNRPGDWTYEIDTSRITLRYWRDELNNIEETISSPSSTTTPQERTDLQNRLVQSVRKLKKRTTDTR